MDPVLFCFVLFGLESCHSAAAKWNGNPFLQNPLFARLSSPLDFVVDIATFVFSWLLSPTIDIDKDQ